jgi:hypothetical protein
MPVFGMKKRLTRRDLSGERTPPRCVEKTERKKSAEIAVVTFPVKLLKNRLGLKRQQLNLMSEPKFLMLKSDKW